MELQDYARSQVAELQKEALMSKLVGAGRSVMRTLTGTRVKDLTKNVARLGGKRGKPLAKTVKKLGKKKAQVALDTAGEALQKAKLRQAMGRRAAAAGAGGLATGYALSQ